MIANPRRVSALLIGTAVMLARGGVASAQGNLTVMGNAYLQSNAYLTQPMTGNVGIGTQNPYTKLHIHDGTDQYAGITLTGGTTNLNQAFIRYSEAGQYLSLSMGAFTNNHLVVANTGRVGIGTTNPDNLLTVNGKNSKGYRLVDNDPILWTMLNAIKAQQALIRELAEKVRLLEAHSK